MKTNLEHISTPLAVSALCIFDFQIPTARAQGTAFPYQGRMNNGAYPANGNDDKPRSTIS